MEMRWSQFGVVQRTTFPVPSAPNHVQMVTSFRTKAQTGGNTPAPDAKRRVGELLGLNLGSKPVSKNKLLLSIKTCKVTTVFVLKIVHERALLSSSFFEPHR